MRATAAQFLSAATEQGAIVGGVKGRATSGGRLLGARLARLQTGSVTPKRFEVVLLAHVRFHDVYDHIEVIHDNPGRLESAVDCARAQAIVVAQAGGDFVGDGAQVWFAA